MKVLAFGIYSRKPEYPRINNLLEGLEACGVEVYECRFNMASGFEKRLHSVKHISGILGFASQLLVSYASLSWKYMTASRVDAILIGYPGYFHIPLVRVLRMIKNRRAPILYDLFFSLHDAVVEDRSLIPAESILSRLLLFFDQWSCRLADTIIIDTGVHGQHLSVKLQIDAAKFYPIPAGSVLHPTIEPITKPSGGSLKVGFVGTYIPLHGVKTIIWAAQILSDRLNVFFHLVGTGQLRSSIEDLCKNLNLDNVTFTDWLPPNKLMQFLRNQDVALGIFGTTKKASIVIPHKIFDICAGGVPFVTADTPAIREVFTHGENAYLVPPGEPKALAEAIRKLKGDMELRERIARGAHLLAQTVFSREAIGREIIKIIAERAHHQKEAMDKTY